MSLTGLNGNIPVLSMAVEVDALTSSLVVSVVE